MQTETQTISFRIPTRQLEWIKQTARNIAATENREYSHTDLIRDSIEQHTFGVLEDEEMISKSWGFIRLSKELISSWIDLKDGITIERFMVNCDDQVDVFLSGKELWVCSPKGTPPLMALSQVSKKHIR